mmetsp:Transcript_37287/g.102922  ORF Transcript_37287/g.102922 Transcript_37287/m.102922 type:complete len:255 (-) Transcript_37287:412-1176(-)
MFLPTTSTHCTRGIRTLTSAAPRRWPCATSCCNPRRPRSSAAASETSRRGTIRVSSLLAASSTGSAKRPTLHNPEWTRRTSPSLRRAAHTTRAFEASPTPTRAASGGTTCSARSATRATPLRVGRRWWEGTMRCSISSGANRCPTSTRRSSGTASRAAACLLSPGSWRTARRARARRERRPTTTRAAPAGPTAASSWWRSTFRGHRGGFHWKAWAVRGRSATNTCSLQALATRMRRWRCCPSSCSSTGHTIRFA